MGFFLALFPLSFLQAQTPSGTPEITPIDCLPNTTSRFVGKLESGAPTADLSFAWNSSVACFPATQREKFTGHQVLYTTILPAYTEMEVKVIPTNRKADLSVYAYQTGVVPPEEIRYPPVSCVRCEVDHRWDRSYRGQQQDHTRTAKNLLALRNPYRVVIGVVGASGLSTGSYTLEVTLRSRK